MPATSCCQLLCFLQVVGLGPNGWLVVIVFVLLAGVIGMLPARLLAFAVCRVCCSLGLPLGTEAPVMTPNGMAFSFFSFFPATFQLHSATLVITTLGKFL